MSEIQPEFKNEQHVYHHSASDEPSINVKVEKNTKGFNYEVTVIGAKSTDAALSLAQDAQWQLQEQYGGDELKILKSKLQEKLLVLCDLIETMQETPDLLSVRNEIVCIVSENLGPVVVLR